MSVQDSPLGSWRPISRLLPRRWLTAGHDSDRRSISARIKDVSRQLHPLVSYRIIALAVALVIVTLHLHAQSSLAADGWLLLLAVIHTAATAVAAPRLIGQSTWLNVLAVLPDGLFCVLLLAVSHGWRGPFWLYCVSAVFWPAFRFSMAGVFLSVTAFDGLVLVTNSDRIRTTVDDGFGGDLLTRMLMVYIIAGAIALTAGVLSERRELAAETERNRIARDLHDGVGKTLGGISLEALSLAHWIERDPAEAGRRARYVSRISEKAAIEVRDVIRGLRDRQVGEWLFPAIRSVVQEWGTTNPSVSLRLQLNGADAEVPVLIHVEVMRMLEELLRNVERHAQADEVRVRVTLSSAGVTLAVRDDGVGFDTTRLDPWSGDGHFGLLGARERCSMLGGRFRLSSAPGRGTEVTIDLPLAAREDRPVSVLRIS